MTTFRRLLLLAAAWFLVSGWRASRSAAPRAQHRRARTASRATSNGSDMNLFSLQRVLLLTAFLLCLQGGHVLLYAQPARAAELDSVLTALHDDGLFTGVLLIGEEGEVVYHRALSDYEGRPLTTRTPLRLASVTKPLTATAALALAEDGRLDLDAPTRRYLPDWPYPAITLRHLLNQTSGLHFLTTVNAHADTTRPVTNADVLALVAEHRPAPAFEPGTAFRYDDANYVTLASVIEAASGQPYAEVMQARVFDPAGMDSARVAPADEGEAAWLR